MDEVGSLTHLSRITTLSFAYSFVVTAIGLTKMLLVLKTEICGIHTPALPFTVALGRFLISLNPSFSLVKWS